MAVQACINGWRAPEESPALPATPAELAEEAAAAVRAGAADIHLHTKDASGLDTLEASSVAAAPLAVRDRVGSVPVGVTTGSWAAAGPDERLDQVRSWTVLPDFASVNWHEPGSVRLAEHLLDRGVGIEAGLHTTESIAAWTRWLRRGETMRALLEVIEPLSAESGLARARALVDAFHPWESAVPVLLHSEDVASWEVAREAARLGVDTRMGLEDTLFLADGARASGNADLVRAALDLYAAG